MDLVQQGLALVNKRRDLYFKADDAVFAELEDLFLMMEGVAVWTHHQISERDPTVVFRRSDNPERMQEQGFILFLLLEQMVPEWRLRVFASAPASPFDLLREAVGTE